MSEDIRKIQNQLIAPFVAKMEKEWQDLYDTVTRAETPEAKKLRPVVQTQLNKIRQLTEPATSGSNDNAEATHDFLRRSKLEFRSVQRQWQRNLVSAARIKTRLANHQARNPSQDQRPQT